VDSIEIEFKDKELKESLKANWIGSESFDKEIKDIARVPTITTLRCNTLLYSPSICLKELPSQYLIQQHPLLKDIIEIRNTSKTTVKIHEHKEKLLIDQRCACYVLRGASIFCKGIMASTNFIVGDTVSVYYTRRKYSNGTILKEGDLEKESLVLIGNGVAKMSRKDAVCAKEGVAIEMIELFAEEAFPFSFANLSPEKFYSQNIGSSLVAHLLEVKEGEMILDVCAAPGGKTTHLAILANNNARIVAIDKSGKRLKLLEKTALEQSITCIECYKGDATYEIKPGNTLKNNKKEIIFTEQMFDKIIVDPPCSSLGIKPLLGKVQTTTKEIKHLVNVQRRILTNAFKLLKKGGLLVYSTCTITPWENEENIRYSVDSIGMKLVKPKIVLVPPVFNSVLSEDEAKCVQRIELSSNYNGFFVALFTKD